MSYPSYTEIIGAVNSEAKPGEQPAVQSRHSIVTAAAKHVKQLIAGKIVEVPDFKKRPLSAAIEELRKGKVKIVSEGETGETTEEQKQDEERRYA